MSRLDELKKESDSLLKAFKAKIDKFNKRKKEIYQNLKYEEQSEHRELPTELKSILEASVRIYKKVEAIDNEIREEEKRIAAQKSYSSRPQRRLCWRCNGTGYETIAGYNAVPMPARQSLGHPCLECHGTGYLDD